MNGNLNIAVFVDETNPISFNEEQTTKMSEGLYPIVLAKDGKFELKYITTEEMGNYSHWDAKDEDAAAQRELYGNAPIVWDGSETGLEHKVFETPAE
jgi:hypothetical protein